MMDLALVQPWAERGTVHRNGAEKYVLWAKKNVCRENDLPNCMGRDTACTNRAVMQKTPIRKKKCGGAAPTFIERSTPPEPQPQATGDHYWLGRSCNLSTRTQDKGP